MPPIDIKLPFHQSEACFRRYEPFILSSVLRHPEPITLVGFRDITLNTFTARLRDARASYKKYNWPSKIPRAEFLSTYNDIKVWQKDGKVLMGTKAAVKTVRLVDLSEAIGETFTLGDISIHDLYILVALASGRQLRNPVKFNFNFYKGQLETILDQNDVDIESVEENTYILT